MEVAIVLVLILMLGAGGAPPPSSPSGPFPSGRQAVIDTGMQLGLPADWINWLVWVSKGEANWRVTAANNTLGERSAARRAYDRLVRQGRWSCPPVPDPQTAHPGSGGWYGQLWPFTVLFAQPRNFGCDPIAIWRSPVMSTHVHLDQVRGTIAGFLRRLPPERQTFLYLRALYGLPSRINNPDDIDNPTRRAGYAKTLRNAGIDPALLDRRVPALPGGV